MVTRNKVKQPRIDIHAHVIPPAILGKAGPHGPDVMVDDEGVIIIRAGDYKLRGETVAAKKEAEKGGVDRRAQQEKIIFAMGDPHSRVAELDALDIDVMGVTIPPLFYFYGIEREQAIAFCTAANDALADYCAAAPKRFFFMPSLPLQDIDASIAEVRRAAARGARGVNMGGRNLAGKELYDQEMWPLYSVLEELGLPLFIHPYPAEIGDAKAKDRYTSLLLDYPFECTRAVNNLILGGVFDDFPNLKVYVSHGGGFIPYQFGRIETFVNVISGVRCKKPPREYLKNFYFDTLIHELDARKYLVKWMGADNLLVGDNHGGMDSVDGFKSVDEMELDQKSTDKIKGLNAKSLFRLDDYFV